MIFSTIPDPSVVNNVDLYREASRGGSLPPRALNGDKAKARALLAAIRTLQGIEQAQQPATPEECAVLARFPGFGPVALGIFPDSVTGRYKDATWQTLGEELRTLLTPEDYASARRTTFTAFYTSPAVIQAMHAALRHLGVPSNALVLEPGCGVGNCIALAPTGMRFIGVALDNLSGRMARVLHPAHDIRIENFRDTHLPEGCMDAVIGNVPFADLRFDYHGTRLALHDFFLAKALDRLKPGGILTLVTSHYTMDKQHPGLRELLAQQADFLGAIRLPAEAFAQEGTRVVTDILCLRKRALGEEAHHVDLAWLETAPLAIEGVVLPINCYFLQHPAMVLGTWSRHDRLYAGEGYTLRATGDLAPQLAAAIQRLPQGVYTAYPTALAHPTSPPPALPPLEPHLTEGSFFVAASKALMQIQQGAAVSVTHGTTPRQADGSLLGRRLAALLALRDHARCVLQSQNEGWPEGRRQEARRALNRVYDRFVATYGPINKTTLSTNADGTTIRRMPNLVTFRDDPDAMLVMALEHYDGRTGLAEKAAILHHDVVGRHAPRTTVQSAEEGLLVSLDQRGVVDLPFMAPLYQAPVRQIIAALGDLICQDPDTQVWHTADVYLSRHVRAKLAAAERAGAAYARNVEALRLVQPEDVLPGDIDAHLGAPWIPESDIQAFAAHLSSAPLDDITVVHLTHDALWSLDAGITTTRSVAATTEYGTARANGVGLLEQALNLKSPTIYDVFERDGKEERVLNQDATLAAREKQKGIKERFRAWILGLQA